MFDKALILDDLRVAHTDHPPGSSRFDCNRLDTGRHNPLHRGEKRPLIDKRLELVVDENAVALLACTKLGGRSSVPELADPGYRGEMRALMHEMTFEYTGWVRAQKVVPVSTLHTGTNNIGVINSADAPAAAIRSTQIQLKYLWDKSDYILKPGR